MKLILGIFLIGFSQMAMAKSVATVIDVTGNAFSFTGSNPQILKYGQDISDMTDLMVEDGGTLSIATIDEKVIHISGGSLVKLYSGIVELKNGHVWVYSPNNRKGIVNSSNSIAHFAEGQFVYSFNNISGKSQLLVLEGDVKFSNSLEPDLTASVGPGYFSLVDQNYENGLPRTPTKVGLKSYKQTKNIFANFKAIKESKFEQSIWGEKKTVSPKASRSIASVSSHPVAKRGKIIYVQTIKGKRAPASVDSPMNYYMNIKKKEKAKRKPVKSGKVAPIRYFGRVKQIPKTTKVAPKKMATKTVKKVVVTPKVEAKKPSRMPASIEKKALITELKKSGFAQSIEQETPKNRRNPDEVNSLIDELNTYNQDYKKKY